MADVKESVATYRLRRVDGGIEVTVTHSQELADSLRAHRGPPTRYTAVDRDGRDVYSTGEFETYGRMDYIEGDRQLRACLFAVGAYPGPFRTTVRVPRTREQLQHEAETARQFLKDWYEENVQPIDIMISIRTRTVKAGDTVPA